MNDESRPWLLALPDGSFLYPRRLRSIDAFRDGAPPDLWVALECLTHDGEIEVHRVGCETWEEADALGRVLRDSMAHLFPQVPVHFRQRAGAG